MKHNVYIKKAESKNIYFFERCKQLFLNILNILPTLIISVGEKHDSMVVSSFARPERANPIRGTNKGERTIHLLFSILSEVAWSRPTDLPYRTEKGKSACI